MSAVPIRDDAAVMESEVAGQDLSAFMDGEADLPSSLLTSAQAGRDWETWNLIGDVLRSEALARPVSTDFTDRLSQALANEPSIVAPKQRPLRRFVSRYTMPGVALAVVVVAVTWVAQPYIAPATSLQAGAGPAPNAFVTVSLPSVTPLADYVDAHRNIAGMGAVSQAGLDAGQP